MTERRYVIPRFGQEGWTLKGVPERRGVWDGKVWTEVSNKDQLSPKASTWERARRAKPTIWAHAEAFHDELRRQHQGPFDHLALQIWAGLLLAAYKGDLEQETVQLAEVDPDLPAAFREGLPFDPGEWPASVGRLHGKNRITIYRAEGDRRPVSIGYAPLILAPALWFWNDALVEKPEALAYRFNELVAHYSDLEGCLQGFRVALEDLAAETWNEDWFHKLLVRLGDEVESIGYSRVDSGTLDRLRSPAMTPFGYRWGGDGEVGESDLWESYALRAEHGRPGSASELVLFVVDDGLDEKDNPWVKELAFPGSGDTRTRLVDLQITSDAHPAVRGRDDQLIPLPAGARVVSLNPRAPAGSRLLRKEFIHLVGDGARLDESLLDEVHAKMRHAVARNHPVTSLLPLDGALLARYPEFRNSLCASLEVQAGAAVPERSPSSQLSVELPVAARYEVIWRPNNVNIHRPDDDTDLVPQIELWPDFETVPEHHWQLYLLRIHPITHKHRCVFPELGSARQRDWAGDDTLVLMHHEPPCLVELADAGDPASTHGTILLSPKRQLTTVTIDPQRASSVAVDFGTTNTSVAFRPSAREAPEVLEFRGRTRPLLKTVGGEEPPNPPGWVFHEERHRGFFSTAIGARESFKLNDPVELQKILSGDFDSELLETVLNMTDLSGLKLDWLANTYDQDAIRGQWEFRDQLKWGTENAEDDRFRLTLRTCFMAHLFLHVAAEVWAQAKALPTQWNFTHPLSMRWTHVNKYHESVSRVLRRVTDLVNPGSPPPEVVMKNESQAIFDGFLESWGKKRFSEKQRVVIADMGGGSVDYAVFGSGPDARAQLIRSDSLRLAGRHFFELVADVTDTGERTTLGHALAIHFGEGRAASVTRAISGKEEDFRKAFNWTLVSGLDDKAGKNSAAFRSNLRELAEERAPLRGKDHLATWLSRLTRVILGHAVLLGSAPLDGERITDLEVVLAGNGWGLLPYSGRSLSDEDELTKIATDALEILRQLWGGSGFEGPRRAIVRSLEEAVGGLGDGVYSKDLVAVGALTGGDRNSEQDEPSKRSSGILGADLCLTKVDPGDVAPAEDSLVRVPWHTSSAPEVARELLKEQSAGGGGASFFASNTMARGGWRMHLEPVEEEQSQFAVAQQLYMFMLLDPSGEFPEARSPMQVEDWNVEWKQRVESWLEQVEQEATHSDYDHTSLIRELWEYYFEGQIRPHLSRS